MSHLMDLDIVMTGKELSSGFLAPAQLQLPTFWLYAHQLTEDGTVLPLDTLFPELVLRSNTKVFGPLTTPAGSLLPLEANSLSLRGSHSLLLHKLHFKTPTSETPMSHSRMETSPATSLQRLFNDFIYPLRISFYFYDNRFSKFCKRWDLGGQQLQASIKRMRKPVELFIFNLQKLFLLHSLFF